MWRVGRENDWTPPGRATSGSGLETTSDEQGSALISGDAIWTSKMCFASGFLRASTLVLLRMFSRKGEGGGGGGAVVSRSLVGMADSCLEMRFGCAPGTLGELQPANLPCEHSPRTRPQP